VSLRYQTESGNESQWIGDESRRLGVWFAVPGGTGRFLSRVNPVLKHWAIVTGRDERNEVVVTD
jgi:hypothetical protein